MCLLLARDIKGALGLAPLLPMSILTLWRGNQLTRKVSTCSKKRAQPAPGAERDLLPNKLTNCLVSRLWWATPSLLYEQSYRKASWCPFSARNTTFFVVVCVMEKTKWIHAKKRWTNWMFSCPTAFWFKQKTKDFCAPIWSKMQPLKGVEDLFQNRSFGEN